MEGSQEEGVGECGWLGGGLEGVVGEDAVVGFGLEVGVLGEREMGLEVGEGLGDLEAGLGEKGGDFIGHEPAEGLG